VNLLSHCRGLAQNRPGTGSRDFHHSLVGFHFHQGLISPHLVARRDQPADDFTFSNAFANIGEAKLESHTYLR
jgi:hypothetical protein